MWDMFYPPKVDMCMYVWTPPFSMITWREYGVR